MDNISELINTMERVNASELTAKIDTYKGYKVTIKIEKDTKESNLDDDTQPDPEDDFIVIW